MWRERRERESQSKPTVGLLRTVGVYYGIFGKRDETQHLIGACFDTFGRMEKGTKQQHLIGAGVDTFGRMDNCTSDVQLQFSNGADQYRCGKTRKKHGVRVEVKVRARVRVRDRVRVGVRLGLGFRG